MNDYSKPNPNFDGLDASFGASNALQWMPPMSEIPDEFKRDHGNKWVKFQSDWFFSGLKDLEVTCKEGIDRKQALIHLAALNRSMAPKHEHKEAAVAYLASLWFDDVTYTRGVPV